MRQRLAREYGIKPREVDEMPLLDIADGIQYDNILAEHQKHSR